MGGLKLSIFIVLCTLYLEVSCCFEGCDRCNDIPYNVSSDIIIDKFKELVPQVWSQDIPLTPLGLKYRNLVLDLVKNGNSDTSFLCMVSSMFFNEHIAHLDEKPDTCAVAAIVNGTLSCVADNDDTLIQGALSQMQAKFFDMHKHDMFSVIYSAGCDFRCGKSPPDPQMMRTTCYKNGSVYSIEPYLNLPRAPYVNISPKLKKIVVELYKSKNHVDNFLAAATSFALSEIIQRLFAKWDLNIILELESLMMADSVSKQCCYSRVKRAEELRKLNDADAIKTITNEKAYLSATKCKPQ